MTMTEGELVCACFAFLAALAATIGVALLLCGDFATDYDVGYVESDVAVLQVWIERLFELVLERCKP